MTIPIGSDEATSSSDGGPQNPQPEIWESPGDANPEHQPGVYAMRSHATAGGHANQCVYDEFGVIMLSIPAGGTADYVSNSSNMWGHFQHDLRPWWMAKALGREEDYYSVRPCVTESGSGCSKED